MQMVHPAAKQCLAYLVTVLTHHYAKQAWGGWGEKLLKNISRAGEAGSSRQFYQTEAQTGIILETLPLLVGIYSQSELYILRLDRAKPE